MHGSVCVCMCRIALLKAKMFKAFSFHFIVYLDVWVKFWVKSDIFFKITCVSFTLIICNSCTY